jgi:hypothetical protein
VGRPDLGAEPTRQRSLTRAARRLKQRLEQPSPVRRFRPIVQVRSGVRRREAVITAVDRLLRRQPSFSLTRTTALSLFVRVEGARTQLQHVTAGSILRCVPAVARVERFNMLRSRTDRTVIHSRLHTIERWIHALEVPQPTPAPKLPPLAALQAYPPVTRTVARLAPSLPGHSAEEARAPGSRRVSGGPIATPQRSDEGRGAIALPAQELNRVADHVIRELDRRVLSYRERTGRV